MRVALCFYGFLRYFEENSEYWRNNFIDPNDADVFISTWDTESYKTKENAGFYSPQFDEGVILDVDRISELYAPDEMLIEDYNEHHDLFLRKSKCIKNATDAFARISPANSKLVERDRPLGVISMYYRWSQISKTWASLLDSYDVVFLSRSDFRITNEFILRPLESSMDIMTPAWPEIGSSLESHVNYEISLNDWWTYGHPVAMRNYCNMYYNLEDIHYKVKDRYGLWESTNVHGLPYQNTVLNGYTLNKLDYDIGTLYRGI